MSRLQHFIRSVFSAYALLFVNIGYTLATVPLALYYLSKEEFGLWALVVQISGYLQLIDAGMSGSVSRLLIDHKDDRSTGGYGGTIKSGWIVSVAQAVIILLAGGTLAFLGEPAFRITGDLKTTFLYLMGLQSVVLGFAFTTRIFSQVLIAHQRYDLFNYAQLIGFFTSFTTLWLGFHFGLKTFSLLWANAAAVVITLILCVTFCKNLQLLPKKQEWGRINRKNLWELFSFGSNVFAIAVGTQLTLFSQTVIITRTLGLADAATWNICMRTFTLVYQLCWRPFDFSYAAFAEMLARREQSLLYRRFRSITIFTLSLSAFGAVMFAVCNQAFLEIWTAGRVSWVSINDLLLGGWLVILTIGRCHTQFALVTKQMGAMRYIYFIEGAVFITLAASLVQWGGYTAIIASSILCSLCFTSTYSAWRSSQFFRIGFKEVVIGWTKPAALLLSILIPTAFLIWNIGKSITSPYGQFFFNAIITGTIGTFSFLRFGVPAELQAEIMKRAPEFLKPIFRKLLPSPEAAL